MNVLARPKKSHIWTAADGGHYVEPTWVSTRLFQGFCTLALISMTWPFDL
jgi:hypothetical protein